MIAVDTNLLLRYVEPTGTLHPVAVNAVAKLRLAGEPLVIFPQNVYEFWSTATRPKNVNGLGWTVPQCVTRLTPLRALFTLLPDQPGLFDEGERLVTQHQCSGKVSYDARNVAAMTTYGLTRLLTFNVTDFARYPGLTVLDPATV